MAAAAGDSGVLLSQQQVAVEFEQFGHVDLALLQERHQEIKAIERETAELSELFVDISNLIHTQGETLNDLAENVEVAAEAVKAANVDLAKASMYQRKSRQKMCCIMVVIAVVLTIIIVPSVLSSMK